MANGVYISGAEIDIELRNAALEKIKEVMRPLTEDELLELEEQVTLNVIYKRLQAND